MRKKILFSLSLLIFSSTAFSFAENITIYRWVDKNNIVHFSQNQPEHGNYTELTMKNTERSKSTTELTLKGEKESELPGSTEQCQTAKANLNTLKTFDKVQYIDENGEAKVLSEEERARQVALNEKQVKIFCGE